MRQSVNPNNKIIVSMEIRSVKHDNFSKSRILPTGIGYVAPSSHGRMCEPRGDVSAMEADQARLTAVEAHGVLRQPGTSA